MKAKFFLPLFFFAVFSLQYVFAQTYCMPTSGAQNVTTTTGTFYDSGCSNILNYSNNENGVITFCPGTPCYIVLNLYSHHLADAGDILRFYSGNNTSAPVIHTFQGPGGLIGPAPYTSTDSVNGCLTVQFISNASGVSSGWHATIGCNPVSVNEIQPSDFISFMYDRSNNHFLNLHLSSHSTFTTTIFSSDGKKISEKNYSHDAGQHQLALPTQNLSQGIYFCRVEGKDLNKSIKFIIQ
jgi:hypothetical protein